MVWAAGGYVLTSLGSVDLVGGCDVVCVDVARVGGMRCGVHGGVVGCGVGYGGVGGYMFIGCGDGVGGLGDLRHLWRRGVYMSGAVMSPDTVMSIATPSVNVRELRCGDVIGMRRQGVVPPSLV